MSGQAGDEQPLEVVSFEKILQGARFHPREAIERWPITEVWEIALGFDGLPRDDVSDSAADWVEVKIAKLIEGNDSTWWSKLLSWYLLKSRGLLAVRALEFAISLSSKGQCSNDVSKLVCKRVRDDERLYWATPPMRTYIQSLLDELLNCRETYWDADWYRVERAVRRIVEVGDITFLPLVEQVYSRLETGQITAWEAKEGKDRFIAAQHRQFFQQAIELLKEEQTKQLPDLNVVIGSYLREKAGLSGGVIARLYYPERVQAEGAGEVEVRLELELTKPEEAEKLQAVLDGHFLICEGCGFGRGEEYPRELSSYIEQEFSGQSCTFNLPFSQKGAKCFSLSLREKSPFLRKDIAEVWGYITIE